MALDRPSDAFPLVQLGLILGFAGAAWFFFRPKSPESGFGLRESDRPPPRREPKKLDPQARLHDPQKARLLLTGFRADLPPHELLGVAPNADEKEIRKAFREKMKQYHPDRVAAPGTAEWKEAQKISQVLEEARGRMIEALQQKKN
jgi:hypothetical protein